MKTSSRALLEWGWALSSVNRILTRILLDPFLENIERSRDLIKLLLDSGPNIDLQAESIGFSEALTKARYAEKSQSEDSAMSPNMNEDDTLKVDTEQEANLNPTEDLSSGNSNNGSLSSESWLYKFKFALLDKLDPSDRQRLSQRLQFSSTTCREWPRRTQAHWNSPRGEYRPR